jgi:hypothetical protein
MGGGVMDILTLKLAQKYTDSKLRTTVTIADKHIFSSEAVRDAYFVSNPGELEEGLYVQAGTQFFRYHDEEWVEVTAIIQGPKGEKGDKGDPAYQAPLTLTATLDTDDWTGTEAPFAQIQEVSGILADDVPTVDVVLSGDWEVDAARLEAWGYIYRIVTSNDSIVAYASEKPAVALPLQLKVIRGIDNLFVEEGELLDE